MTMGADIVSKVSFFLLLLCETIDKVQKPSNPEGKISVSGGEA
jgi:hypothetical protein